MPFQGNVFIVSDNAANDRADFTYADPFTPLTSLAIKPLLDAAEIRPGKTVLDVATGTGSAAAAASARGAQVVGVDVSPTIIAIACNAYPGIDFRVGDVNKLSFPDGSFDAVICNFGLGHFPAPEAVLDECVRVLAPEGALAVAWWDHPDRQPLQAFFLNLLTDFAISPGLQWVRDPEMLRFSDAVALGSLLHDVGLGAISVMDHRALSHMEDVDALWRAGMGGLAPVAAAIGAQDVLVQIELREELARRAEAYRKPSGLEVPVAFLVGRGRKTR